MGKIPKKVQEIREWQGSREVRFKSVSFSQLSLYCVCPERWNRAYRLHEIPYAPSIHTTFGTSFHETLQNWLDVMYNQTIKASNEIDLHKYLLERMKINYESDRKNLGKDFSTSEELQEFYEDGIAILDYIKQHRKAFFSSKEWLVGCEIPLLVELKPGFYFKGFIDVLTYDEEQDRWKIWDIKTSTSGWNTDTKSDFVKTSQLLLYQVFLSKQFNIDMDKIDIEYFIVKRKINEDAEFPNMKKRVQEFVPTHGSRNLKKAARLVDMFISGALTDEGCYQDRTYEANPSEHNCKWCLFKDTCKFVVS